jgi:kelch-like protein 2/3
VERYDPNQNKWTMVQSMTIQRSQVGAGVLDGLLFAVGGYNDLTDFGWTSTVEK